MKQLILLVGLYPTMRDFYLAMYHWNPWFSNHAETYLYHSIFINDILILIT